MSERGERTVSTADLTLLASDEQAHAPGPERLWGESWYFDFTNREGTLGGYVRLGLYPNLNTAWYWACLVGEGRPLVTVIDHDVSLPSAGSLEVRADGLWADHTVETPFEHLSLGQIHAALAFYYDHKTEVDRQLDDQDARAAEFARSHPDLVR